MVCLETTDGLKILFMVPSTLMKLHIQICFSFIRYITFQIIRSVNLFQYRVFYAYLASDCFLSSENNNFVFPVFISVENSSTVLFRLCTEYCKSSSYLVNKIWSCAKSIVSVLIFLLIGIFPCLVEFCILMWSID